MSKNALLLRPRSRQAVGYCIAATLLLTAADLASKTWALNELSVARTEEVPPACRPDETGRVPTQRLRTPPIVLIEDYFELRYAENCAAAFSMFESAPLLFRRVLFSMAAVIAVIMLFWMFVRGYGNLGFALSVPLIASGALGNLIDRLRYGYVVDFLRFHIRDGFEWPTFNLADSTITVGVILWLLDGFFKQRAPAQVPAQPAEASAERTPA